MSRTLPACAIAPLWFSLTPGTIRKEKPSASRIDVMVRFTLAVIVLFLPGVSANATGKEWLVEAMNGDVVVKAVDQVPPAFSAKAYAQTLVPPDYRSIEGEAGNACSIEVALKPLSLLGDVLSFSLTYRRLPGECEFPLRDGGYHAIRSVRLETLRPARLDEIASSDMLLRQLQIRPEITGLLGTEAAASASLAELFAQLDRATLTRCDRRLTSGSLSAFYVGGTNKDVMQLQIAFDNACGQLADDPAVETIPLTLHRSDFKQRTIARIFRIPGARFRFVSSR